MTTKIRLLHDTVGIPTGAVAVTQSASDNTTKVATTAYVTTALAALADSAPSTLNTLNELAAALGDDANFSTTVTNSIATKAPLATPQFTNRVGIGVAAHASAGLNITSTAQHMRLNNGSELGIISLESDGALKLWSHGDSNNEIEFYQGSGSGSASMTIDSSGNLILKGGQELRLNRADNNTYGSIKYLTGSGGLQLNDQNSDGITFIRAGSSESMRIDSTGRVTFGPDAADIQIDPASTNSGINLLYFRGNALHDKAEISLNHYGHHNYHMGAGLVGNGKFSIGTSQTDDSFVMDTSGNIGINNDSPAHRLHIQGNTNDLARVRVTNTSSGQASLDLNNSEGYFRTYTDGGEYRIYDQTDGTNRFIIDTSGNVGIGTTGPSNKLEISGTGGTRLKVINTDTNWAGLDLQAGGNQANYIFFRDGSAERARIMATDGNEISFSTGASPVQRLKLSNGNDIVLGTGAVNEAAKVISSGGTTVIRAADSNHSIILRGTQDASGNITGNSNTMGFYEYGGYEFYTKQGNSRVKSLDMPANGKVNIATSAPRSKYFDVNGVAEISESFYLANNVQYDFEYTVTSEGGAGNSFFIIAGYNHFYNTTYGAHRVAFMSARTTSMASMINLGDQNSSSAGQWQFTKSAATTLRIRKTAGSYGGGGHGFIKVFFRDH